jgi:DMSO/TMAO reductase YedYZ molybdopterin-dependent catalytic subunit
VVVIGADEYVANVPIEVVEDCVLVYAVGDQPLPVALGGPARLVTRGIDRCANVKRVRHLRLAVEPAPLTHVCPHQLARALGGVVTVRGQS